MKLKEQKKLKKNIMKKKNLTSLKEFIDQEVGVKGTKNVTILKQVMRRLNLVFLYSRQDRKKD